MDLVFPDLKNNQCMTLPLIEPVKYYYAFGYYYRVTPDELIEFNESYCLVIPETVKENQRRREWLASLQPINYSEGEGVKNRLVDRIMNPAKELCSEPVASHSSTETNLLSK
jgi:hypothetical protein